MSLDNITGPETPGIRVPGAMITLTQAAVARIRYLLDKESPRPEALAVSVVEGKGCSGLKYDLQYLPRLVDAPKFADKIVQDGVVVVVDPKAALFIIGSVMDYRESPTHSGFEFDNPNEVSRCGCGESFSVAPPSLEKR